MAQSGKSKPSTRSGSGQSGGSRTASSRTSTSKPKTATSRNGGDPGGGASAVKDSVVSGTQDLAEKVGDTAKKTGTAVLAGGAAAAGLAATVIIAQRARRPRKVLGISMPKRRRFDASLIPGQSGLRRDTRRIASKVGEAADRADRLGKRVSGVATSVKQVSETAEQAAKKP